MGRLGNLRAKYLENETKLLEEVERQRERYRSQTLAVAKEMGLEVGPGSSQRWDFNPDEMTFTRVR
jgi:hypothetical protein